jgi:hypothetical protein
MVQFRASETVFWFSAIYYSQVFLDGAEQAVS